MFRWAKKLFRRRVEHDQKWVGLRRVDRDRPDGASTEPTGNPLARRRWEAADTNRLNKGHWQLVHERSINLDLQEKLATLRARCAHEASSNPMVEGVIRTHTNDVVGPAGPSLQIQSSSPEYNEARERVWREWWARPDVNGKLCGADFLRLWVRSLWLAGEYLAEWTVDNKAAGPVKSRLLGLHASRLATPPGQTGGADVILGVRLDADGRPLGYWISKVPATGRDVSTEYEEKAAEKIVHGFERSEPDQVRGCPLLAPSLQVIADIRDYDDQVLDAARAAADQSVLLYSDHPDADFLPVNESEDFERRTTSTIPPGWKAYMVTPTQPSTRYVDYRHERMREIGRPVDMPLMMIVLDSRRYNYSSARFDGQGYARGLAAFQAWVASDTLGHLEEKVAREAQLAGALPEPPPGEIRREWNWPKRPHVDPQREANAERTRLENGTLTYTDALAAHGKDRDTTIATRQREREALEAAGLPPLPTAAPPAQPVDDDPDADDDAANAKADRDDQKDE